MSRKRSSGTEVFFDAVDSPIGTLYLICDGRRLCGIAFDRPSSPIRKGSASPVIKKELAEYFDSGRSEFTHEVSFRSGTAFEKAVWSAAREIPYGETRTYKWIAEKIGKPGAARAVGQALSRNPIPILVPCHRVIESDGSLGGYSGGVERKRRLLDIEYYVTLSRASTQQKGDEKSS